MATGDRSASETLSAELEAKLLRQLGHEWRSINYAHLKSALRMPTLTLVDGTATGEAVYWCPQRRSLELERGAAIGGDWAELLEAIKRETIQQFVDERLGIDEQRHGPAFRRVCRRLGVRTPGERAGRRAPGAGQAAAAGSERVLARIHKLLALARSPNQHEAETAALTARRLMLKFNIAADETRRAGQAPPRDYGYRHLRPHRARVEEHDHRLARLLGAYFFVESAWLPVYLPRVGRRASVLEICGLPPNLELAEHVHDFVLSTAQRLWLEYRAATPEASAHDRLAYLAGVVAGLDAKLEAQASAFEEQGLVWLPSPDLGAYFRRRNPRLRYGQGVGGAASEAHARGRQAGQRIVLSTPVSSSSSAPTPGPPRALPPGSAKSR